MLIVAKTHILRTFKISITQGWRGKFLGVCEVLWISKWDTVAHTLVMWSSTTTPQQNVKTWYLIMHRTFALVYPNSYYPTKQINPRSTALQKVKPTQSLKEFLALCGLQRFVTVFRETHTRFWHSEDRESWYNLIMKANEMHYFSNVFDKVFYMFRTRPLSIIRSISTL